MVSRDCALSVIIPLYNKEQYIESTLKSVLAQTFERFEVIIVDDGSTDNSLKVIDSYNDPRIKVIRQVNQGVSVARNSGIKNASTEWITFLDADDYWHETFLEKIFALTKTFPNGKIFSTGRKLQFATNIEEYSSPSLPNLKTACCVDYIEVISNSQPPINSSSCLIRRELLIQSNGFVPGMRKFEDHELWIRLALNHPIYYYNEPLSIYRKDVDEKSSGSKNTLNINDLFIYLQTLLKIKESIKDNNRLNYLQLYIFRFFIYNYMTNCTRYNSAERSKLLKVLKSLVNNKQFLMLASLVKLNPKFVEAALAGYRYIKTL